MVSQHVGVWRGTSRGSRRSSSAMRGLITAGTAASQAYSGNYAGAAGTLWAGRGSLKRTAAWVGNARKRFGAAKSGGGVRSSTRRGNVVDVAAGRGATTRKASSKGKLLKASGTKSVKVSKSFRKKVVQTLESKKVRGKYTTVEFGNLVDTATWDCQGVGAAYPVGYGGPAGNVTGWCFNYDEMIDAISVLWNNKTPSYNGKAITTSQSMGVNALPSTMAAGTPLEWHVVRSYAKFVMKNNHTHTVSVKVYDCQIKQKYDTTTTTPAQTISGGTMSETDCSAAPYYVWSQAVTAALANDSFQTNSTNGISTLGLDPRSFEMFTTAYKCVLKEFVLEPGQTAEFYLDGPRNKDFSFLKDCVKNYAFMDIGRQSRYPLFVTTTDIVGTSTGHYGRGVDNNVGTGNGVIFEKTLHYTFSMPEMAGSYEPVVGPGAVVPNIMRHKSVSYNVWTNSEGGTQVRVDEEQPDTVLAPI